MSECVYDRNYDALLHLIKEIDPRSGELLLTITADEGSRSPNAVEVTLDANGVARVRKALQRWERYRKSRLEE